MFMDKKLFLMLGVGILLVGAGCTTTGTIDTNVEADTNTPETSQIEAESGAAGTVEAGSEIDISNDMIGADAEAGIDINTNVKTFTVTGGNFEFTPASMTVKKGDTVRITFMNVEGFHDFVIDEFDVATKQIQGGAEEVVEFVADETGSFEYYCSVGSHRAMGMKGTLTVTE
jgi:plastocyanin